MTKARLRVAAFFGFSGLAHLTFGKKFFEAIVPPWLPASPKTVNQAAGAAELTGAGLALVPGGEKLARRYLTALLLAVFPANCHMAVKPEDSHSEKIPNVLLWARLPLQFVIIAWVWKSLPVKASTADPAASTSAE
jgi:uncharacterized membrane protein